MTKWTVVCLAALGSGMGCNRAAETGAGKDDKPAAGAQPASSASGATAGAVAPGAKSDGEIPEIPEGRSSPPTIAEWGAAAEINTQEANSRARRCFMKIVREWLKVNCRDDKVSHYTDMEGFGKQGLDWFESVRKGDHIDVIVRVRRGTPLKLRIWRDDGSRASLFMNWPGGAPRPTIVALAEIGAGVPAAPAKPAAAPGKSEDPGAKAERCQRDCLRQTASNPEGLQICMNVCMAQ
jgi:hypothetical protein